jgi:hypothetical protein
LARKPSKIAKPSKQYGSPIEAVLRGEDLSDVTRYMEDKSGEAAMTALGGVPGFGAMVQNQAFKKMLKSGLRTGKRHGVKNLKELSTVAKDIFRNLPEDYATRADKAPKFQFRPANKARPNRAGSYVAEFEPGSGNVINIHPPGHKNLVEFMRTVGHEAKHWRDAVDDPTNYVKAYRSPAGEETFEYAARRAEDDLVRRIFRKKRGNK